MRAAPVSRYRVTGQASTQPLQPLRQRFGWFLVQVGLRLAVHQART
jgi:hypothetical protein